VSTSTKQKTLIVRLANNGYIYIPDTTTGTTRLETPNDRHPTEHWGGVYSRQSSAMPLCKNSATLSLLPTRGSELSRTER
jgi:hypothetical protein